MSPAVASQCHGTAKLLHEICQPLIRMKPFFLAILHYQLESLVVAQTQVDQKVQHVLIRHHQTFFIKGTASQKKSLLLKLNHTVRYRHHLDKKKKKT